MSQDIAKNVFVTQRRISKPKRKGLRPSGHRLKQKREQFGGGEGEGGEWGATCARAWLEKLGAFW